MNAESFAEYLKNPSKLYQINYQELKSLALQYPYCKNLQWLLLHKSGIDHHRDFNHNLEKAAAGSLDRTLLFHQIKAILDQEQPSETLRLDEVLELQDLSKLRLRTEPLTTEENVQEPLPNREIRVESNIIEPDFQEEEEDELDFSIPFQEDSVENSIEKSETELTTTTAEEIVSLPEEEQQLSDAQSNEVEWEVTNHEPAESVKDPEDTGQMEHANQQEPTSVEVPLPKSAFNSWSKYQPPQLNIKTRLKSDQKEASKPLKEKEVDRIVKQSVEERDELVSETLATILARQGQTEKAIMMYERLILLFPEKSTYFAAQISKLKRP